MGQRLVVTIEREERELAKLYYHWSGYTADSLYRTRDIIHCIYDRNDETDRGMLLRLIRFCENNGGGIDSGFESEEWKYITSMYPTESFKRDGISRNDGLIALSPEGMADMQKWSEGDVFINLDTDQVDFCVYAGYESLKGYIEERKSWDDDFDETELVNMPTFDFSLGYFNVNDIDAIIANLDSTDYEGVIKCDGEICEMIC